MDMFTIGYAVYLFFIATILALLEIQIEGKDGWAKNLPCWRPKPDSLPARIYAIFMNGKELTGYHAVMFPLPLLILHFPFVVGTKWNAVRELETLSIYFLMAVVWDFLWFVWNPAYGLRKFKPEFISWHKKWWGPFPKDYPIGVIISFLFGLIAGNLLQWFIISLTFGGLTLASFFISLALIRD
jgi:hypothetical protein